MNTRNHNISKREFLRRSAALSAGIAFMPCSRIFSHAGEEQTGIYKRVAMFQEETPAGIMCRICPNECVLKEGQTSRCRSKKVYKSQLHTLAFGNPCSVAVDPVEKKPLYHFLPSSRAYSIAAAGCNLACLNCQNWTISQSSPEKTRNYDLPPEKVVEEAIRNSCASIAYTYSEPTTFYEYVFETASIARQKGVRNIMKSNGYINPGPLKKLCTVIDGANIDLKSFNETTYLKLSGGKLQPVLETLKVYRDAGVWLEITNLLVPSWTDKLDEIRNMCRWLKENGFETTPLHFSRFYPLHKLEQLPPTPVETLRKAYAIAVEEGLKYVYIGNAPESDRADTLCPGCGAKAVVRRGYSIAANNIKERKCVKCAHEIEGVWS